jgi:hypothetical protein
MLGQWMRKKWRACQGLKLELEAALAKCRISDEILRSEWAAQVASQTKPPPRESPASAFLDIVSPVLGQSKTKGRQAVEYLIELIETLRAYKMVRERLHLDSLAASNNSADVLSELRETLDKIGALQAKINKKRAELGISENLMLTELLASKFLQHRMNARALKQRLRDLLHARKFALESLERAYRHTTNGECLIYK